MVAMSCVCVRVVISDNSNHYGYFFFENVRHAPQSRTNACVAMLNRVSLSGSSAARAWCWFEPPVGEGVLMDGTGWNCMVYSCDSS